MDEGVKRGQAFLDKVARECLGLDNPKPNGGTRWPSEEELMELTNRAELADPSESSPPVIGDRSSSDEGRPLPPDGAGPADDWTANVPGIGEIGPVPRETRSISAERAYVSYESQSSHIWGDPLDIASKSYAGIAIKLEWLPASFSAFISDVAYRTGFDPGVIAQGCLAAAAGVADDALRIVPMLKDLDFMERPCVWTLAVAASGSGKTNALLAGIRPIEEIDREIVAKNLARVEQYRYDMDKHAEARKAAIKAKDLKPPPEPEAPPSEEIFCNTGTLQGVRQQLKNTPRGILWFRDEWGGQVGEWDRFNNGSADRFDVLELYNGGQKKTRLVTTPIVVPNWSAVLCGGITPSAIREFAGPGKLQEDGLLQRFMICMGQQQSLEHDIAADRGAIAQYHAMLRNLRDMQALGPSIKVSADAYAERIEFLKAQAALQSDESLPPPMRDQLGKWRGLHARLCLLFHIVDLAANHQYPSENERVSGETAKKVSNLLLFWQYSHLEEFWMECMSAGHGAHFSQRIANFILSKSITKLSHNLHIVRPHFLAWDGMAYNDQRDSLQRLENAGWMIPDGTKRNKQGFPTEWIVSPAVHQKFTAKANQDASERSKVRAQLKELRSNAAQTRQLGD